MHILPEIIKIAPKTMVGLQLNMSVAENKTGQLWQQFISLCKSTETTLPPELYSLQIYPSTYFQAFNPQASFEKWALMEWAASQEPPSGMEHFHLPAGQYALFHYKGPSVDKGIFSYIFQEWLPSSGYMLDGRPHFEVLGLKYSNTSPESEEDIYIPIR